MKALPNIFIKRVGKASAFFLTYLFLGGANLAIADQREEVEEYRSAVTFASQNGYSTEKLEAFIRKYPKSIYVDSVKEIIVQYRGAKENIKLSQEYAAIAQSNDVNELQKFLDRNPNSQYAASIKTQLRYKLEQQAYNKALLEGTIRGLEDFIKKYPDGNYTTSAITELRALKNSQQTVIKDESVNKLAPVIVMPSAIGNVEKNKNNKATMIGANRIALVIGNDDYLYVNPLVNAKNDAKSVADSLTKVGYKVNLSINLNEKSFKQALRQFKSSIQPGDEVLFYFAGHGVQISGTNYLLPVDIKGDNEDKVKDEAIQLQRVLDDIEGRDAKLTLAVIDACRDNPFKSNGRSIGGRGLVPTTPATGQMIIFSAGNGQRALDSLGPNDRDPNGLFTRIFIKEIQTPGVPVDRILKNVREKVVKQAKVVGHDQVPALYDQVIGEFYFKQ